MDGTLLAAMDVPPIVLIVVALVVLFVVVKFVLVPLYVRLGRRPVLKLLLVLLVGAVLYAGGTLFVAWQTAGDFAALASSERTRADAVQARLAKLGPMTTPLGEACATADRMQIKQLVGASAEPELKVNEFRHFGEDAHLNIDIFAVPTTSPSLRETWEIIAFHPGKTSARLPSPMYYVLSRKRYALVHAADRAALVDLEDGRLVCAGSLPPAPPQEINSRGRFLRPLMPICERIEGDACAWIRNTLNKKDAW